MKIRKVRHYGWRLSVSEVLWITFLSGAALWIRHICKVRQWGWIQTWARYWGLEMSGEAFWMVGEVLWMEGVFSR